jgi:hypothetical protein
MAVEMPYSKKSKGGNHRESPLYKMPTREQLPLKYRKTTEVLSVNEEITVP